MSDLGDLYVDAEALAAAQREAMRDAARALFAKREGDLFGGGAGPVPRVVLSPRYREGTRNTVREMFGQRPPTSPLEERLRGRGKEQ